MSDGMTDNRSQPNYATPYIPRAVYDEILADARQEFNSMLLKDERVVSSLGDLTIGQFNRLGSLVESAVTKAITQRVKIR